MGTPMSGQLKVSLQILLPSKTRDSFPPFKLLNALNAPFNPSLVLPNEADPRNLPHLLSLPQGSVLSMKICAFLLFRRKTQKGEDYISHGLSSFPFLFCTYFCLMKSSREAERMGNCGQCIGEIEFISSHGS